ncbi:hypothetical protein HNR42_002452 [Deinobacterium chartae]|uniref:Uncharacterized protein n=1 Tax=Deinobacterium chartae TaxID=521158 RepID=A0A841I1T0_9DEIO|nr:hypothetical protein [Deinobacterium chartae]MBB6099016.1 hypothetical protein [Deinobacterium chartae]
MKKFWAVLSLLAAAPVAAAADVNFKDFQASDLCKPEVYVTLNEEDDAELAGELLDILEDFATLYEIRYGSDAGCILKTYLTVDAYEEEDGRYTYVNELSVEFGGEATLSAGGRSYRVKAPQLWSTVYYGLYADQEALLNSLEKNIKTYYEELALAWKKNRKP